MEQEDTRELTLYDFECEKSIYNILVVEDSKFFNNAVKSELTSDGHTVTQAFTLKEASSFIETMDFDFILLDLILPDGEGDEIIDSLPKDKRSKVIVLSADEDSERRDYIFKSGILDYFSKSNPFHLIMQDIKKLMCNIDQNSFINILIVDDSSFIRRALKSILIPKKFNIYEAKSAKDGLKILHNTEIHLLLLDYEMPEINGMQMLAKVKANRKFLELPVMMLSGSNNQSLISTSLKHGACDFIKKPYVTEELLLKIDLHVKEYINRKKNQTK
jgi:DNA-binding response OmpR family regulator